MGEIRIIGLDTASDIEDAYIAIDSTNGTKKYPISNIVTSQDNAGYHNSIYRGKFLGNSVTTQQYSYIGDGSFKDMFIGDYWTIDGVVYRIACFDYYYGAGDTACTTHHVTLVPDIRLYNAVMNDTYTTVGAYVNSQMYTTNLDSAKNTINNAFGSSHILNHRNYLKNAIENGAESGATWADSTVELMTEQNVYGSIIYANQTNKRTIDKTQFPLFAMNPNAILGGYSWWLRDVAIGSNRFCNVNANGLSYSTEASSQRGVRPAFSICAINATLNNAKSAGSADNDENIELDTDLESLSKK